MPLFREFKDRLRVLLAVGQVISARRACFIFIILLGKGTLISAGTDSAENPVQFLSETQPMAFPEFEQNKNDASRDLFARQLTALRRLAGTHDPSLFPLLIPYIYYTDDYSFLVVIGGPAPHQTRPVDLKSWAFHWPALAEVLTTLARRQHSQNIFWIRRMHLAIETTPSTLCRPCIPESLRQITATL
jgi:hypothetical protein